MNEDGEAKRYIERRRGLLNKRALPQVYVLEDLIFPKKYFTGKKILSLWKEYVEDSNHKPIDFYIHVPFCYTKCTYCTCPSDSFKKILVDKYVDDLINYLSSFKVVFKNTSFRNLYIGGGTPSVLSDANLEKLLEYIFRNFHFDKDGGRCSEMNPLSVTESKIAILKKYKFNRISYGVQSLDPEILKLNNRGYQSEEMVERAIEMAKKAGINHINVDLIIGLYGDSKERFLNTFKKLLSFKPYSISVYPLQPKKEYIKEFFHGHFEEYYAFYSQHVNECLKDISLMAKNNKYFVPNFSKLYLSQLLPSCWHYRDLSIPNLKNSYIAGFEHNVSVFGIGKYAESKIDGVVKYRRDSDYGDLKSCVFSGMNRSRHLEMIFYITDTLSRENSISLKYFKSVFGVDLVVEFKHEIDVLLKLNVATVDSKYLYLSIDDKRDRSLYLSCFFKDEDIERYFKRRNNRVIPHSKKYLKNALLSIKDEAKISKYQDLLRNIRSLPIEYVLNGTVLELIPNGVKVLNDDKDVIEIAFDSNCLFTREYAKENIPIYEEKVSTNEILTNNLRLVFFMKKAEKNVAIIVKQLLFV